MWAIKRPTVTAEQTAKACARRIRDQNLKQALRQAIPTIASNSVAYQASGAADSLHETTVEQYRIPGVSDSKMRWIYAKQLARAGGGGRQVYDELMSNAPHDLCSYCRDAPANTLDHFVPQSPFGGLAIEPWNLIPCCLPCNKKLGSIWSEDPSGQRLHPYFLDDAIGRWLYAEVVYEPVRSLTFFAEPGPHVNATLAGRIRLQFDALGLNEMYSVMSGPELSSLDGLLRKYQSEQDVKDFLMEVAGSALAVDPNDRRGVFYEALGSDEWFAAGCVAE